MRTTTTLFLLALSFALRAQTPGDSLYMFFDDASDDLQLDSVYPAGCWEVGTPMKAVFTSAYSPGRALVTDTLLPYPDSTTCYAEFTLISTNENYSGRSILFEQMRDMDNTSKAYFEVRGEWSTEWHRYGTEWPEELIIDGNYQPNTGNGHVMVGSSNGWESVQLESQCMGVFWHSGDRWYEPTMHVRLVFESLGNTSARDGWMIDNVRAGVSLCSGGIGSNRTAEMGIAPIPANDQVTVTNASAEEKPVQWTVLTAEGRMVLSGQQGATGPFTIPTNDLEPGAYALRCADGLSVNAMRFVVEH